jgi:hypothetical protein
MRREMMLDRLLQAAQVMLQGSLSQTTRTCGRPGCRCQRGERHGPHTYLTFRTPEGRSSSLYVPPAERPRFLEAVAAWERFWRLATQLAQRNREEIVRRRRSRAPTPRRTTDARGA